MVNLVHSAAENVVVTGFIGYLLVVAPVIGIIAAHKSALAGSPGLPDGSVDFETDRC